MKNIDVDKIFWGVLLILIGLVFFLNNIDWIDISIGEFFVKFWPSILILIGLKNIILYISSRK